MSHVVRIKGKQYKNLKSACIDLNISYRTVMYRVNKLGWSINKALTTKPILKKSIKIGKLTFSSLTEACNHFNISMSIINNRINVHKWSLEKAFATPKSIPKTINIGNKNFKSLNNACVYYKIDSSKVIYRLSRNWTLEEAFELIPKKVSSLCKGKVYIIKNYINSKVYIGITLGTLENRFKQHMHKAKHSNTKFSKAIRRLGSENFYIKLVKEVSDRHELSKLEEYYINKLNSINCGYNTAVGGYGIGDKFGKSITYNNVTYESISALSRCINISISTLKHRLENNIPLEAPIKKGVTWKPKIKYKNKVYTSVKDLAKHLNISLSKAHYRINNNYCLNGKTTDTGKEGFYTAIFI